MCNQIPLLNRIILVKGRKTLVDVISFCFDLASKRHFLLVWRLDIVYKKSRWLFDNLIKEPSLVRPVCYQDSHLYCDNSELCTDLD